MEKRELNQIYSKLNRRCAELMTGLHHRAFHTEWNWYNGHYSKNPEGIYELEQFPIPVISVKGLCDVEISLEAVTVTTKRNRLDTLEYSFQKFSGQPFECYGVEQYLEDYLVSCVAMDEFRERIRKSQERELGFSFLFHFDIDGGELYEFAKLLRREGFYY